MIFLVYAPPSLRELPLSSVELDLSTSSPVGLLILPRFFTCSSMTRSNRAAVSASIPLVSLSGKAISRSLISQSLASYPIRKTWWLYLLLEKNLAISESWCRRQSLRIQKLSSFRNGKCFRRVTQEGYSNRFRRLGQLRLLPGGSSILTP